MKTICHLCSNTIHESSTYWEYWIEEWKTRTGLGPKKALAIPIITCDECVNETQSDHHNTNSANNAEPNNKTPRISRPPKSVVGSR